MPPLHAPWPYSDLPSSVASWERSLLQEQREARQELARVDPTVNLAADTSDRLGEGFGLRGAAAGRDPEGLPGQRAQQAQRGHAPAGKAGLEALAYDINRCGALWTMACGLDTAGVLHCFLSTRQAAAHLQLSYGKGTLGW